LLNFKLLGSNYLKRVVIYLILLFSISKTDLFSQAPIGEVIEVYVNSEKDTVVINRSYGELWAGISGGMNLMYNHGSIYDTPDRRPFTPIFNQDFPELSHSLRNGLGLYLGISGDWQPQGNLFGAQLRINFLDLRNSTAVSPVSNELTQSRFFTEQNFAYLTLSPAARFNFKLPGLYTFFGPDIEIPIMSDYTYRYSYVNSGNITEHKFPEDAPTQIRLGATLGIAYEFIVADFRSNSRFRLSPHLSVSYGTGVMDRFDYSSLSTTMTPTDHSFNNLVVKFGISVKFGADKMNYDTLKFDPYYIAPVDVIAAALDRQGIFFESKVQQSIFDAQEIAYVALPKIKEEVKAKELESIAASTPVAPAKEKPKFNINIGQTQKFSFPTSTSTELTKELRDFLDALADFLKENPNVEARIVGHSDNMGTSQQNQERSTVRAKKVADYLISKNVARTKVPNSGLADRRPLGDIRTEAGRRSNRRVEITIVGK